jgi:BirA family biotin operon repressor/biotin-[acetyl-CoA-carboxylase] ligase
MLNAEKIKNLIHSKYPAACVRVFDTTDSTNTRAKEDKTLSLGMICARAQTAGRGRQGHSFYSPADTGLYMTAVLPITPMQAYEFSLTAAAAVACVRAISKLCKKTPLIKWVNDLYIGGKKIAGILTEADSN